jgi:septin 6/8/11
VNIIPVIGKADTINKAELSRFKAKIMAELKANGVSIYQFPTEDETVAEINKVKRRIEFFFISVSL